MQVTLTITDGPSLPADALARFVESARQKGKDPSQLIGEFIINNAQQAQPAGKRRKATRKDSRG